MTHELKITLQSILDSIANPAFIKQNGTILLTNEVFNQKILNLKNLEKQVKDCECFIDEKDINNNMKLCEVVDNDIKLLQMSKQNLATAIALL